MTLTELLEDFNDEMFDADNCRLDSYFPSVGNIRRSITQVQYNKLNGVGEFIYD